MMHLLYSKYHNCYSLPDNDFPIPKIIHHIWIRPNKSELSKNHELPEKNIINTLDHYQKFQDFHKILWINDESLYPKTIARLNSTEIEIRNINDLKKFNSDIDNVNRCLYENQLGAMVDWLKYEIVKNFGGVVLDLNFKIFGDPISLHQTFDEYSFIALALFDGVENFFIAAYKQHPILQAVSNNLKFTLEKCPNALDTYYAFQDYVEGYQIHKDGEVNEVFEIQNKDFYIPSGIKCENFIGIDTTERSWKIPEPTL